jgi:uncharacterized protein (AIM24 family)
VGSALPPPDALRRYSCPFCDRASDGQALSCPACGAPVDVQAIAAPSGWLELPGIRDMARLEFGRSSCQIEGLYVPVADFRLAPGDGVYFTHHVLLWKDPDVSLSAVSLARGWTRVFAGLPLVMAEARGPGHVAFSRDAPGEMMALPLEPGQAVDIREHVFVAATSNVGYDWFQTDVWFRTKRGDETELHYPVGMAMDRFTAGETPGLVLVHGAGNVFERRLGPDEIILVKPTALLLKDPSVRMHLHIESPVNGWQAGPSFFDRYLWLRLYGPGRVAIQSAFKHLEDSGGLLTSHSPMTRWRPLMDGRGAFVRPPEWYYQENGETRGPVREDQLEGLALVGRIPSQVPVWTEGLPHWTNWREGTALGAWSRLPRLVTCPFCGGAVRKGKVSAAGWLTFAALLVVCFPLCVIGLFMRDKGVCLKCGKTVP